MVRQDGSGNRLPTGISVLDRDMEGGLPPGTMVALEAPPATQAEVFIRVLCRTRPTLYLTTLRSGEEVREELAADARRAGIDDPPDHDVVSLSPENLLSATDQYLPHLGERWNLVVDTVTAVENRDQGRYREFLNDLKSRLDETGSLGVLFAARADENSSSRWLTLHRADVTWELYREVTSREIGIDLVMAKFRDGEPIDEPRKLVLTDDVRVDTSRDIG